MNRRSAIRYCLTISGAVLLVPSCLQEKKKMAPELKHIKIDNDQLNRLAALAEMIIPTTSSPGAKELSSHEFALMMVDDCYDPSARQKFENGLLEFNEFAKSKFGDAFEKCSQLQKENLLTEIENKKNIPENVLSFYADMKKLTIQSFTSSQYFLTKIHVYELVPGRFHGCVPVSKTNND